MSESDEKDDHPTLPNERNNAWEQWFQQRSEDMEKQSLLAPPEDGERYRCPCCHYKTLEEGGGYDICPVCFWENDGQDDEDADVKRAFSLNCVTQ